MIQIRVDELYALVSHNAALLAQATAARGQAMPVSVQLKSHLQNIDALVDKIEESENPISKLPDAPPISGDAIGH